MSQLLQRSRDYSNLLDNVIENELLTTQTNNEVLWVQMGNQLEIEGIPKEQISTIVRKDIEDKLWEVEFKEKLSREDYRYCNSKYYESMKNNGWTNPFMARNFRVLVDIIQGTASKEEINKFRNLLLSIEKKADSK